MQRLQATKRVQMDGVMEQVFLYVTACSPETSRVALRRNSYQVHASLECQDQRNTATHVGKRIADSRSDRHGDLVLVAALLASRRTCVIERLDYLRA